jgi:hypothetical protein
VAIEFDGATERVDYSNIAAVDASDFSIALRFNPSANAYDGDVNESEYLANFEAGAGALALIFFIRGNATGYDLFVNWFHSTTSLLVASVTESTDATGVHIYLNGSEVTYATQQNGVGTPVARDDVFVVAGRTLNNTRNLTGRLADYGVWDAILSTSERQAFEAGSAPSVARATNLVFDAKFCDGDTEDAVTSSSGTVNGTPVSFTHPNSNCSVGGDVVGSGLISGLKLQRRALVS